MVTQSNILKLGKQLNSKVPSLGARIRRSACAKLAEDRTEQAVPFLVSALANSDGQVRSLAEEALKSLDSADAIDALALAHVFTKQQALAAILESLGRQIPENPQLPAVEPGAATPRFSSAEKAWHLQNEKDRTILAFIPQGDFIAGRDNFNVNLGPYYLAMTCVTNAQYTQFLNETRPNPHKLTGWIKLDHELVSIRQVANTYEVEPDNADLPAVWVTWQGASAYCKWANLRLPTELEWEKAARGTDGRLFPWGDEWEDGRPKPAGDERTTEQITGVWEHPTARSAYGLYQMIGNIYEWCADSYEENAYKRYAKGDLRPPKQAEHKVLRGGPWCFGATTHLRTEFRESTVWRVGTLLCGFRCAKSL